jgi:Lar family restriction alleviation protein
MGANMSRPLAPCPFCGADRHSMIRCEQNIEPDGYISYYVHCYICGASGGEGVKQHDAVMSWNMRKESFSIQEEKDQELKMQKDKRHEEEEKRGYAKSPTEVMPRDWNQND